MYTYSIGVFISYHGTMWCQWKQREVELLGLGRGGGGDLQDLTVVSDWDASFSRGRGLEFECIDSGVLCE